jgi:hypothetical protein
MYVVPDKPDTQPPKEVPMSALAAIAVFPVLTLLLFGLTKAENVLSKAASLTSHRRPADPPVPGEAPSE